MKFIQYSKNFLLDIRTSFTNGIGRGMREAGLQLDRQGCQATSDISYLEPMNRRQYENVDCRHRLFLIINVIFFQNHGLYQVG